MASFLNGYYMPSSVVAHMSYNPELSILQIRFVSGLVYDYKKVPLEVYEAMRTSSSKGEYLNKHIKGNYPFKKVS
ncbi:MAG: KTSC domain-containing protein [Chitinophagaceae bacterium]